MIFAIGQPEIIIIDIDSNILRNFVEQKWGSWIYYALDPINHVLITINTFNFNVVMIDLSVDLADMKELLIGQKMNMLFLYIEGKIYINKSQIYTIQI